MGPQNLFATEDEQTVVATAVLQHRLQGRLHHSAVSRVSATHSLSPVEVDRSWASHKREALTELTIGRVVDACPWTEAEIEVLLQIFSGEPWFTPARRD